MKESAGKAKTWDDRKANKRPGRDTKILKGLVFMSGGARNNPVPQKAARKHA